MIRLAGALRISFNDDQHPTPSAEMIDHLYYCQRTTTDVAVLQSSEGAATASEHAKARLSVSQVPESTGPRK